MKPAILIHGPTASGKTALAIALAGRVDGEVINADSMQIYADLKLISARPDKTEMGDISHHLFGHVDAATRYSTKDWLDDATKQIAAVERRGKVPILVGGTGLYFLSLIKGLSEIPPVPEEVRAEIRQITQAEGADGLRARLMPVDPETATRLGTGDKQRLGRALSVWMATGKPISAYHGERSPPTLADGQWLGIALTPPRTRLYQRIDRRFDGMLLSGALEEVRTLVGRGLDPELPCMKALGVPYLAAFIRGEIAPEIAAENAKRDTRRYAKRQFTWIGRQFPFWPKIPSAELNDRLRVVLALYNEIDRG